MIGARNAHVYVCSSRGHQQVALLAAAATAPLPAPLHINGGGRVHPPVAAVQPQNTNVDENRLQLNRGRGGNPSPMVLKSTLRKAIQAVERTSTLPPLGLAKSDLVHTR